MAITEVKLLRQSGREDATGLREYTSVYHVETDSTNDGPRTVKNAAAGGVEIPKYGSYWKTSSEVDKDAFLSSKDATHDGENPKLWYVTCVFSTATNAAEGQAGAGLVLPEVHEIDLAPEYEWDFDEITVPAYFAWEALLFKGGKFVKAVKSSDAYGRVPIVNSAMDFYDPPLEEEESRLVLRISRAVGSYNPILALKYANALNSDTFYGFPPYTIRLRPIKAKAVFNKGFNYWRISAEMQIKLDGWYHDNWDAGLREYLSKKDLDNQPDKGKGKKAGHNHIKNIDGSLVTDPVLLDGYGHQLVMPGKKLDLKEQQPYHWRFRTKRALPFGPLNLL